MRVINGYTVLMHKPSVFGGFIILAGIRKGYGYEYVVAEVYTLDSETWSNGYYSYAADETVDGFYDAIGHFDAKK